MSNFPPFYLYLLELDIDPISNSLLCEIVNSLSKERAEHIYIIMLLYNKNVPLGRENRDQNGIMFFVNKLPEEMLLLIGRYVMCELF